MIISGFFPDVNDDRLYTNDFLAQWVHSFISNGVYNGDFAVTAGENMQVVLPSGQAWINGYYCRNDGNFVLPIANADGVLKRKDTVVLRWDINTRDITAKVLTGTFASNPIAPPIVRNAEQYDLKLAEIDIAAGTINITQSAITDMRFDNNVCGIVHAVVDHIDTTTLFNQLQAYMTEHEAQFSADMAAFKTQSGTDFNTWFNGIKGVLGKDEAGNLLNLINAHASDTAKHITQTEKEKIASAVSKSSGWWDSDLNFGAGDTVGLAKPSQTIVGTDTVIRTVYHNNGGRIDLQILNGANDKGVSIRVDNAADWGGTDVLTTANTGSAVPLTTPALRNEIIQTTAPTSFLGVGTICNVIS